MIRNENVDSKGIDVIKMGETFNTFINKLVFQLYKLNNCDITFVISPLYYDLKKNYLNYYDLFRDLYEYSDYEIVAWENSKSKIGLSYDIEIRLKKENMEANYQYLISSFSVEADNTNYCTCKKEDEGYRKDKNCCGVVCDWTMPAFKLHKKYNAVSFNNMTQFDYWLIEDSIKKEFILNKDYLYNFLTEKQKEELLIDIFGEVIKKAIENKE